MSDSTQDKYTKVLYFDEVESLLAQIETITMEDMESDEEVKILIQEFIFKMDDFLRNRVTNCTIIDLRKYADPN